jgi:formamidopyrimidine-DNA glycosylase
MVSDAIAVYNPAMPELPEVETVVRDLRPLLVGRTLRSVEVSEQRLRRPWKREWSQRIVGRRVEELLRRGKWIVGRLDDGQFFLVHLGMTGQLTVASADTLKSDHTHLILPLDDGANQLRFRDIRRFGCAILFEARADLDRFFTAGKLGPEPFDLQAKSWREKLTGTDRSLKAALLDQRLVAGVGNIYADESLFEARLPPSQKGTATSTTEADRLRLAIVKVLNRAIEQRGSSIRNYVGGSGLRGGYQEEFRVYGRPGQPCARCKTPIERVRLAGRSTHYCPKCQKEGSGARGQ